MKIINTTTDLALADQTQERTAFLTNLLNDYITFDDAVYPENYDSTLQPGDTGYVEPVIRKEWNAGAAAAWGFADRTAIEYALTLIPPATAALGDEWTHPESGEVLVFGDNGWEPQVNADGTLFGVIEPEIDPDTGLPIETTDTTTVGEVTV